MKKYLQLHYLFELFIGFALSFLMVTFVLSYTPVLEEIKVPKKAIKVTNGEQFNCCRTVEYFDDGRVTLDKSLIKNTSNGEIITLSYSTHSFTREKGTKTICKEMILPMVLEEGIWTVETVISYKVFPFWTGYQKLQDVYLDVNNK